MEVSMDISYATSSLTHCPLVGLTTHQLLEKRVQDHPDREMYVFPEDNERITFKDFKDRIEILAAGLLSLGMKKCDRLVIWENIHMEFVQFVAAARSIGVVTVRIRPNFPNTDVHNIMLRTDCKVVLLGRSPIDLYDRIEDMKTGQLKENNGNLHTSVIIGVGENNKRGTYSVDDVLKLGSDPTFTDLFKLRKNEVVFDDDSDMFTTSGSTGKPKYALHTHFSIINGFNPLFQYLEEIANLGNRRILSINSAHIGGEGCGVIPPLLAGMTSVFSPPGSDIQRVVQAIQDERCTIAGFLISALYDMVNFKDIDQYDVSSLDLCLTGGSSIPSKLLNEFESKFASNVLINYGSTEIAVPTMCSLLDSVDIRCSNLRILPNYEIQVVDDAGRCVPIGSVGEIWCRGSGIFQEYYGNEEKTMEVKTPKGWFKTGDLGVLNGSGYLSIFGRKKDVIIRGGINIFPVDIENILSLHPSVDQVQVIGVPDERMGEDICICIRTKTNARITKEQIAAYLNGKVTSDESNPGYVLFFDVFPKSDVGKIDRVGLREQSLCRIQNQMTV